MYDKNSESRGNGLVRSFVPCKVLLAPFSAQLLDLSLCLKILKTNFGKLRTFSR